MRLRAIPVSMLMIAATLGVAPSADATFPGVVGKIAFYAGVGDIATVDPDGSDLTIIDNRQVVGDSPAWSPDGNMIALRSGQEDFSAIWVMNSNGTAARRVTTRQPGESVGDTAPSWSPDGTKIVFQRDLSGPTSSEIFVVNVDGTGLTNLTNSPGFSSDEYDPVWSPDGSRIAFQREADLWVMNSDGSGAVKLTQSTGIINGEPSWSPDSIKLAFIEAGTSGAIWTINPDGTGKVAIRPNCGACELWDVAWSPDGTQIGFIEDFLGDGNALQEQLWTMNADGTDPKIIVQEIGISFDWGVACTQNCVLPPECEANQGAICGSNDDDAIEGTPNDDIIFGSGGDDIINGGGGNDTIVGGAGNDVLAGGPGDDLLVGDDQEQSPGAGRALHARGIAPSRAAAADGGDDEIDGGGGRDSIFGGAGLDRTRGGGGKDKVRGENDNDDLDGGGGNDNVDGGDGEDTAKGSAGDDKLIGGLGKDLLNGGPGKDLCVIGKKDVVISCESTQKRNNQRAPV